MVKKAFRQLIQSLPSKSEVRIFKKALKLDPKLERKLNSDSDDQKILTLNFPGTDLPSPAQDSVTFCSFRRGFTFIKIKGLPL